MDKSKKDNKNILIIAIFIITMLGIGFLFGFLSGKSGKINNLTFEETIFQMILVISVFIIIFMLQIILHEAGHLIFGLLSGYKFVSFRIGSITIIREDKKFKFKKFKIKGTAGQCLMMPKTENYEELKYISYNLGGVLINFIVTIISGIILLVVDNKLAEIILKCLITTGLVCFISNGIPMKIGGIANDGYNILAISKDKFIKYCFYIQLKVNGLLYKGIRMKDMPIEWFYVKEGTDLNIPMVTAIRTMEANYYHDKLDFERAKTIYEDILKTTPNILKLYENEIKCELLFYEILNNNIEKVNEVYTKDLRNYIKLTECYVSRKRLMYAYNLIILKDKEKADNILVEFKKIKKTYPAKGEIASEEEVISLIDKKLIVS